MKEVKTTEIIAVTDTELQPLVELEAYPAEFAVNFSKTDLLVMLVAGFLGTLSSMALKGFFAEIHDHFNRKITLKGGHTGESVDDVPGNSMPGGFGHRWKYGHDILNPFEVDWDYYIELAKQSGKNISPRLQAYFYWLRHLFQDTFSTEGLPLPGNSILRLFCNFSDPQVREFLQIFGTIKMRDIAGSGVTNIILNTYLQIRESPMNQLTEAYMFFGSNSIAFLTGLLVPVKLRSLNFNVIPLLIHYSHKIHKIQEEESKILEIRDHQLTQNKQILAENNDKLYLAMSNSFERLQHLEIDQDSLEMTTIRECYKHILQTQEAS